MLAGGVLGIVTVILPPAGTGSDVVVIAIGSLAAVVGTTMIVARRPLPEWVLALVLALGTLLITLATYEGGAGQTGTADNEILYLWGCLFAFYFLSLPHALVQLSWVGFNYGLLLHAEGVATNDAATRLVVTLSTLLVAGLLVVGLRRWLDGLLRELGDRARLDSLTGLLNRQALEERAALEFARRRRDGSSVGVLIIDIDGFKAVNDSIGHLAGDDVLRRVAEVLETETRVVDAVARVGGDEFAVLLPGATATAAMTIAERLCTAVHESLREARIELAISIGVASAPGSGETLEALWQAADWAMYGAKRGGGNTVAAATAEPRTAAPMAAVALVEP
jgi:diguanylate cyclase (GGDEF)-like protein